MGVQVNLNNQHLKINTCDGLNQLQEWQNDLDFWNLECNQFLQLMKWENTYISSQPNPLTNQFRVFVDEEIVALSTLLNRYRAEWKREESTNFKMQYRKLYLGYHHLKIKFRSLKVKALSGLIKSNVRLRIY